MLFALGMYFRFRLNMNQNSVIIKMIIPIHMMIFTQPQLLIWSIYLLINTVYCLIFDRESVFKMFLFALTTSILCGSAINAKFEELDQLIINEYRAINMGVSISFAVLTVIMYVNNIDKLNTYAIIIIIADIIFMIFLFIVFITVMLLDCRRMKAGLRQNDDVSDDAFSA